MADAIFPHKLYDEIVEKTVAEIKKLGALKGGEYAGDVDRLANFRRNGTQVGLPMETIWAIYYNKHHDSVMQFIRDQREGKTRDRLEPIAGRVDDMITYLILFKCMLAERNLGPTVVVPPPSVYPAAGRCVANGVQSTDYPG